MHHSEETAPRDDAGRFRRGVAAFRQWIRADGSTDFAPEPGRYHLVLASACPWCHRVAIVRALKGLEDVISVSWVHPLMLDQGWRFTESHPDTGLGVHLAREYYQRADPDYRGRITVPILWDRRHETIVSNESAEIIRMLTHEFEASTTAPGLDLYPEPLRAEIDVVNGRVYPNVNNGVYRCGFAGTQLAYDEAFHDLFGALDHLEGRLGTRDWLVGDQLTEADVRLWVTLVRFDAVYFGHFKCNLRRIQDMPALQAYLRRLYRIDAFRNTTRIDEIKHHYYGSHRSLNPKGIVPLGPELSLEEENP